MRASLPRPIPTHCIPVRDITSKGLLNTASILEIQIILYFCAHSTSFGGQVPAVSGVLGKALMKVTLTRSVGLNKMVQIST